MIKLAVSAVLGASLCASAAMAQDILNTGPSPGRPFGPWYGSVSGGYAMIDERNGSDNSDTASVSINDGYVLAAAIGYKWPKYVRTELEFSFQRSTVDSLKVNGTRYDANGEINVFDLALNAYHDIDTGTKFKPYLGGGVGGARLSLDNPSAAGVQGNGDHTYRMEAHGEVGVGYELGHEVVIGPSYRYTYFFDGSSFWENDATHQFKLNMRFPFR